MGKLSILNKVLLNFCVKMGDFELNRSPFEEGIF